LPELSIRPPPVRRVGKAGRTGAGGSTPDFDDAIDEAIGDDLLSLVFTACYPVLSTESRVALTLRVLGGLKSRAVNCA